MSSADNPMTIYVKNERGIAIPLFLHGGDRVNLVWEEIQAARAISSGTMRGKELVFKGEPLLVSHTLDEAGIENFSVLELRNTTMVKKSVQHPHPSAGVKFSNEI